MLSLSHVKCAWELCTVFAISYEYQICFKIKSKQISRTPRHPGSSHFTRELCLPGSDTPYLMLPSLPLTQNLS